MEKRAKYTTPTGLSGLQRTVALLLLVAHTAVLSLSAMPSLHNHSIISATTGHDCCSAAEPLDAPTALTTLEQHKPCLFWLLHSIVQSDATAPLLISLLQGESTVAMAAYQSTELARFGGTCSDRAPPRA